MIHKSRHEAYQSFVEFVRNQSQQERNAVNRRMLSVLLWCFVIPAILSALTVVLVRFGVLPFRARMYVEWIFLVFPISYSVYFLSSEVLRDLPLVIRQGGIAANLRQCETDGAWRERVVDALRRTVHASREEWRWIHSSFRIDLETMRYRTRFLTALAGAVFFIITQGLDLLTEEEPKVTWVKDPQFGWMEMGGSDLAQWAGLILFLVLLYLSGSQNHNSLARYLNCAELAMDESFPADRSERT